jgi:hypothetical protein
MEKRFQGRKLGHLVKKIPVCADQQGTHLFNTAKRVKRDEIGCANRKRGMRGDIKHSGVANLPQFYQ